MTSVYDKYNTNEIEEINNFDTPIRRQFPTILEPLIGHIKNELEEGFEVEEPFIHDNYIHYTFKFNNFEFVLIINLICNWGYKCKKERGIIFKKKVEEYFISSNFLLSLHWDDVKQISAMKHGLKLDELKAIGPSAFCNIPIGIQWNFKAGKFFPIDDDIEQPEKRLEMIQNAILPNVGEMIATIHQVTDRIKFLYK